jgi:hypothetical protein
LTDDDGVSLLEWSSRHSIEQEDIQHGPVAGDLTFTFTFTLLIIDEEGSG